MGCWFFCKTVTHQYWNVVTTQLSEEKADSFHEFAIWNDALTGVDYLNSLEYLETNSGKKANYRRLANKMETSKFYEGFAKIGVGTNSVPLSAIKAILNPSNPSAVHVLTSELLPLDYQEWVIEYFKDTFNYNEATSSFIEEGITFTIDLTTANSETNTVECTNTSTDITYTLDIPAEPIGDSYRITYQLETSPGNYSPTHTWVYDIASGEHPELDIYTEIPDKDPTIFKIFPEIPIRVNNTNYGYGLNTHTDYDEYAELIGIDPASIIEAYKDNPDMNKLDHIAVCQGVNLEAKDRHSLKYCIDFIEKLLAIQDTYGHTLESVGEFTVHNKATSAYNRSDNTLAPMPSSADLPGIELVANFDEFAYILKVSGVDKVTIYNDAIETSPAYTDLKVLRQDILDQDEDVYGLKRGAVYGSHISSNLHALWTLGVHWSDGQEGLKTAHRIGEHSATNREPDYRDNNIITYFKVHTNGDMDCYTLVQPVVSHHIRDTQSGQTKVMYVDLQHNASEDGADIYLPLDWRILEDYDNQAVTFLSINSLYMVMYYAYWEQTEEWNFAFLTIVIIVIVAIVAPQLLKDAFTAITKSIKTALAVDIATAEIIASVLLLASTGVFGEEAQLFASIALTVFGFTGTETFTVGLNQQTFQALGTGVDIMNHFVMEHYKDEFEAISTAYMNFLELVENEMDALMEILEELGYYKRQDIKRYTTISLLNYKKQDILEPMDPGYYVASVKDSVKVGNYFDNMYDYTYT